MKPVLRNFIFAFLMTTVIVSQTGCTGNGSQGSEPLKKTDFLLNTVCSISLYGEGEEALIDEAFSYARDLENKLSRTIPGSDVDRINQAKGQAVEIKDPKVIEVLGYGKKYGDLSGGLFDITVGRLSELWNFSAEKPQVPPDGELQAAVPHIGYQNLTWTTIGAVYSVKLSDGEAKIDLGGVAKGYIADQVADFLKENGITRGIVNFGGNIICIGEKAEDRPWTIGVEKPFGEEENGEKETIGTIPVKDLSIVTSGTYERKFSENGTLYYHILDPKTGYPKETDLDGVTIIGKRSVDCDGLSTTCLMMGLEQGKALIDSLPGYEAIFITKFGEIICTDGVNLTRTK